MNHQVLSATHAPVSVRLLNDRIHPEAGGRGEISQVEVAPALVKLFGYAHHWALSKQRRDPATLRFSSMLAAMVAGPDPLCVWLRQHLALRGVSHESVADTIHIDNPTLPNEPIVTSSSFRAALAEAQSLALNRLLDVRHFMAAYAVVRNYHAEDFLRLHIDRRAWCLELAQVLEKRYPEEAGTWATYALRAPAVLLPGFDADLPRGDDLLGIGREVETFAMLIAGRQTLTPLSIGVFGAWGSGKSYFMERVEKRVVELAKNGPREAYFQRIAQVRFNAWHYSEGNIIASLVDQIVRNLRFEPAETDAILNERRQKVLAELSVAEGTQRQLERELKAAQETETALRSDLDRIGRDIDASVQEREAEIARVNVAIATIQDRLAQSLAHQEEAVAAARRMAPAREALAFVTRQIFEDEQIRQLEVDVRETAENVRWLGLNQTNVLWGVVVVLLTALAAFSVNALKDLKLLTGLVGLVTALTPIAAKWLALLRDLASKGRAYQEAVRGQADRLVRQIEEEGKKARESDEADLQRRQDEIESLHAEIAALPVKTLGAQRALADGEARRRKASEDLASAMTAVAMKRTRLAAITSGSLLEEIVTGLSTTDTYRKELGTIARARTDFERLSERMLKAREDYDSGRFKTPPVLDRIVLYIDDLDRCPEDKVREVLRAAHLLLAFDLFVCVVAVDPRWVIQCLSESPGIVSKEPVKDADLEVLGGVATPSDYLEKIFQIPLWLRPVPDAQRAALIETLLGRDINRRAVAAAMTAIRSDAAERDALETTSGQSDRQSREGEHTSGTSGYGLEPELAAERASADQRSAVPEVIRIDPRELEFLARATPLLDGNVRALKRFVNTYRLVKAALPDVELEFFAKTPYRLCIAQLAILATQRRRARALVMAADKAAAGKPRDLGAWLTELDESKDDVVRGLGADLRKVLLPELEKVEFARFALWLERTRRYSFYL